MVELIVADIFKNVIMKQIYHNKDRLNDTVLFVVQTYEPEEIMVTGGVTGRPVAKILMPHEIRNVPATFYNWILNKLALPPMLLTQLLARVEPKIDAGSPALRALIHLEPGRLHDRRPEPQLLRDQGSEILR